MDNSVFVLVLANLALIGILPRIFFRPGRLNARWWATALPFFIAAFLMIAALAGRVDASIPLTAWLATTLGTFALLLAATSIALIGYTLGTHRTPLSLWHQSDQTPVALVTSGAYARMRHPFYSAFILALLAAVAALPHWGTLAVLVIGVVQLDITARSEERKLLGSTGGDLYAVYMGNTGRFLPIRPRRRRQKTVAYLQARRA